MKRTLLLSLTCSCLLTATVAAQTKTSTTPKLPQSGYYPPPTGTQLLVAGGSDDCSTAAASDAISGVGTFAVTNVSATNGAPDAVGCANTQLDVWFFWTSTQNGTARVQFCGQTMVDTVITVWADNNGGACPSGSAVACNDDACGTQSRVTFPALTGETFFFQLGAFGVATTYSSNFIVDYLPPLPLNDSCATPLALPAGDGTHAYESTLATTGTEGQSEAQCLDYGATSIGRDLWFTWTPTASGPVVVTTCGLMTAPSANADTKLAVYDGFGCPTAPALACNDDQGHSPANPVYTCSAGNFNSTLTFTAVCGSTYTLQVGQFVLNTTDIAGSFQITQMGSPCPPGPGTEYCAGDGLSSPPTFPCPCGNTGAAGNGCASSFNPAGAHITASGLVAADNVVLTGTGMQTTGICVFLKGDAIDPNGFQFGDGMTCTGGTLVRLRGVALGSPPNGAQFPVPPETITLSARGGNTVGSGQLASYTVYYRNAAAAFCPPFTFNCANSYRITW